MGAGAPGIGVSYNDSTKKVVSIYEQEDVMADLKTLHEWYQAGIINADANTLGEAPKYRMCYVAQGWPRKILEGKMQQGFYIYRNNIYYGSYREEQVSGYQNVSLSRPERIMTAHQFNKEDRAVRFWENHHLLEPEYADLQAMICKMQSFMNLSVKEDIDFSEVEKKLGVPFPAELKLVYAAIADHEEYFANAEHFLPLDEIYVEQGIIVFFKKKRTPIAGYDIESGRLAQYYKREWHVERSGFCCYQFCVGRMLTIDRKSVV